MSLLAPSRRRLLSTAALLALGSLAPTMASAGTSATQFIENLARKAIDVLGDPGLSPKARAKAMTALLRQGLALKAIGRHVIGRHLKQATPEQVAEYDRLFEEYSIRLLVSRLDLLTGLRLEVLGERTDGPDGFAVSSRLISPNREPITILWRLRRYRDSFKIVDVYIENLSMASAQRSDFASAFQRHGRSMAAFLAEFRRKVEALRQPQA